MPIFIWIEDSYHEVFLLFLQNAIIKTSLSAAVEEQKNIDEKVLKLAEELKVCLSGSTFAFYW